MSLRVENLNAGYGKFHILYDVNFEVRRGEIVVVVGPNGAGKSTLLNAITGLATVFSGKVVFEGSDITGLPPHKVAELGVGYTMQSPNNFGTTNVFGELTVRENLVVAGHKLHKGEFERRVEEVLEIFPKLRELMDRRAKVLSGGERQMLAIALGLVRRAKLLLLDEPTAGLAPKLVAEFMKTISHIRDRFKVSIVLVEQNVRRALEIGDRAYLMVTGRVIFSGSPQELLEHKEFGKLYLGL